MPQFSRPIVETITQRTRLPVPGVALRRLAFVATGAARPADGIVLATVTRLDDMVALASEWDDLFARAGRPHQVFQQFAWLHLWAQLYLDRATRLAIFIGRRAGRLVFVWPLVETRRLGLRVLSGMGEPLSQYCDALIDDELGAADRASALAFALSRPVDVVALRRVRDDAAIAPALRARFTPALRVAAPYVDLAGVADAALFEARFPGKIRASRRRRRRRLAEIGTIEFTTHGPSSEAVALVEAGLEFKRAWAREAGVVSPALRDPRFARFFRLAAEPAQNIAGLRASALRCGGEIVGVEISVACGGRLFGHVLAPRPGDPQLGLGGILAETIILEGLAAGYAAVDLLAPADPYKLDWTTATQGVCDYVVPCSPLGHAYDRLWLRRGRERAKRLVRRWLPYLIMLWRRLASFRAPRV